MTGSDYRTTILASVKEVPDRPRSQQLRVSGFSAVLYVGLRVDEGKLPVSDPLLAHLSGEYSYEEKLRGQSGLVQTALIDAGTLLPEVAAAADAEPGGIRMSLMRLEFDTEYLLAAVPLVFSTSDHASNALKLRQSLGIDDLLQVVDMLTSKASLKQIAGQVASGLSVFGVGTGEVAASPLTDRLGLQIWNLEGSSRGDEAYRGVEETRRFAWELSALMTQSADHVARDLLWPRLSEQVVYQEVRHGFTFLNDHMVLVNNSCCLEISHLPVDLRSRSASRLDRYGYDSSSIFVWTIAMLRAAIMEDLNHRYRNWVERHVDQGEMSQKVHDEFIRRQLRHHYVVHTLLNFRTWLKEPRNRAFDEEMYRLLDTTSAAELLERYMDRAGALATSLARARDETRQMRTNTLLAVLAAGLALVGVPAVVEQFANWLKQGAWGKLAVASGLMLIFLVLLAVIIRSWARKDADVS